MRSPDLGLAVAYLDGTVSFASDCDDDDDESLVEFVPDDDVDVEESVVVAVDESVFAPSPGVVAGASGFVLSLLDLFLSLSDG